MTEEEKANYESLRKQLHAALAEIPKKFDFQQLGAMGYGTPEELREKLDNLLGSLLSQFPHCTASAQQPWQILLLKRGPGTYVIEAYFAPATFSALVFDILKINASADAGLIDEGGEPVWPPPCCPTCLRPHGSDRVPLGPSGEPFFTNHTPPQR